MFLGAVLRTDAEEPAASLCLHVIDFDVFGMPGVPGHDTSPDLPVRQRPSNLHALPCEKRTLSHMQAASHEGTIFIG